MKKFLLLFLFAAFVVLSCNKDNYGPIPTISFESWSLPSIDSNTAVVNAFFRVKDGDGDIDSAIFYRIHYFIANPATDTARFGMKHMAGIGENTGKSVNAQVKLPLEKIDFVRWIEHTEDRPDSMWMEVFIQDRAGNISDTITTKKIPIFKKRAP
ncbi:hypothetical protein CLV59_103538 [Chitinophaga dinghuensis]|uniref:NigD-like protein n=1 Tax=Chitinophaga dinghuensis TaxID=1539050 RepID=A0A327W5D9_9BACT|nr:hypothetical protein [Chitinophaga dinghuensis]RAJ83570.1 hypothetical protein CLV59_103538 [Chitinophaga dinghuensis]